MPQVSPHTEIESLKACIQRDKASHKSTARAETRLRDLLHKQLRREVRAMKRKAR
jgi:hypothetical protein